MKKLSGILVLGLLWCDIGFTEEYLDAFTLDKKKIENNVINSVSTELPKDKKIKFKSIKNWKGSFENYKVQPLQYTFPSSTLNLSYFVKSARFSLE